MPITITHGKSKKKYSFSMEGTEEVIKNLNKLMEEIQEKTIKGVSRAALFLRRKSLELTPEDTGNLKESCFVVWSGGTIGAGKSPNFQEGGQNAFSGKDVDKLYSQHSKMLAAVQSLYGNRSVIHAAVNYSAWYALFVHEIKKNHPIGQWKFLETAMVDNENEILRIIAETVKSKGGGFTGKSESF